MAQLIKASGETIDISPANGTDFQLEELYKHLDCNTVEFVYDYANGKILIIDEEGKFTDKEYNYEATRYCHNNRMIHPLDKIVGDAILCDENQIK